MGLLNKSVKNINQSSLNTQDNVSGDVNVPSVFTTYHGVETNSAIVGIDNTNRAISVVVKPIPGECINDILVDGRSVVFDRVANIEVAPLISNAVETEVNRAIEAEAALQEAIIIEGSERRAKDLALQHSIELEQTARIAADLHLQDSLDSEILVRQEADAVLQASIDTVTAHLSEEILRASHAESLLQTAQAETAAALEGEQQARQEKDSQLEASLVSENERALAAESSLRDSITSEAVVRSRAVSGVQTNLDAYILLNNQALANEVDRATNAEVALQNNIDAEAIKRAAAITSLSEDIDQRFNYMETEYLEKLFYCNLKLTEASISYITTADNEIISGNMVEVGSIITGFVLNVKYSKLPFGADLYISINDGAPVKYSAMIDDETPRSTISFSNLNLDQDVQVSVSLISNYDGANSELKATIDVVNGIYYGAAISADVTEA